MSGTLIDMTTGDYLSPIVPLQLISTFITALLFELKTFHLLRDTVPTETLNPIHLDFDLFQRHRCSDDICVNTTISYNNIYGAWQVNQRNISDGCGNCNKQYEWYLIVARSYNCANNTTTVQQISNETISTDTCTCTVTTDHAYTLEKDPFVHFYLYQLNYQQMYQLYDIVNHKYNQHTYYIIHKQLKLINTIELHTQTACNKQS